MRDTYEIPLEEEEEEVREVIIRDEDNIADSSDFIDSLVDIDIFNDEGELEELDF